MPQSLLQAKLGNGNYYLVVCGVGVVRKKGLPENWKGFSKTLKGSQDSEEFLLKTGKIIVPA